MCGFHAPILVGWRCCINTCIYACMRRLHWELCICQLEHANLWDDTKCEDQWKPANTTFSNVIRRYTLAKGRPKLVDVLVKFSSCTYKLLETKVFCISGGLICSFTCFCCFSRSYTSRNWCVSRLVTVPPQMRRKWVVLTFPFGLTKSLRLWLWR